MSSPPRRLVDMLLVFCPRSRYRAARSCLFIEHGSSPLRQACDAVHISGRASCTRRSEHCFIQHLVLVPGLVPVSASSLASMDLRDHRCGLPEPFARRSSTCRHRSNSTRPTTTPGVFSTNNKPLREHRRSTITKTSNASNALTDLNRSNMAKERAIKKASEPTTSHGTLPA